MWCIIIWATSWENRLFAYAKTKTQISCAVTAQLISAFVFAIQIAQSLYYLNLKFQASSHLMWLYSQVCVGPGLKPRRPVFSQRGSYTIKTAKNKGTQQQWSAPLLLANAKSWFSDLVGHHMSHVMRKYAFCICENKGAVQLCHNHAADQHLCFRYIDSAIPLLFKSEISSL